MFKLKDMRWLLVLLAVLLFVGMQNTVPKEAVADVKGQPCLADGDCPCWGEATNGEPTYGAGIATCEVCEVVGEVDSACEFAAVGESVCDVSLCMDTAVVGEWFKDNPINWLVTNPLMTTVIVILLGVIVFYPKT